MLTNTDEYFKIVHVDSEFGRHYDLEYIKKSNNGELQRSRYNAKGGADNVLCVFLLYVMMTK